MLTLRLSPLLPIPIAAYNYLYAVLSVTPFEFFAGITLGSIKPYLLDCYLGLFGKSFLLSSTDTPDSGGELVLLGVVALVVIVGSFAAQVAARSWEEIQQEINMLQQTLRARDDPSDLTRYGGDLNDVGLWDLIGVKDEELPQFLRGWKQTFDRAYTRLEIVLFDEWSKIWNDLCENEKNLQSQTVLRAGVSANMVLPPKYEMSSEASEDSNERAKFCK